MKLFYPRNYFGILERELRSGSELHVDLDGINFRASFHDPKRSGNDSLGYTQNNIAYGPTLLTAIQNLRPYKVGGLIPIAKPFNSENSRELITPFMLEGHIDMIKGKYNGRNYLLTALKEKEMISESSGLEFITTYDKLRENIRRLVLMQRPIASSDQLPEHPFPYEERDNIVFPFRKS